MDSRDILRQCESLLVLFDTPALKNDDPPNDHVKRVLHFVFYDHFHYIRIPSDPRNSELENIEEISIQKINNESIQVSYPGLRRGAVDTDRFHPQSYMTTNIADPIPITDEKLKRINIFRAIDRTKPEDQSSIFVTSDDEILSNRRRLEEDITHSNELLTLMNPEEASELLGIFMRNKMDFIYFHNFNGDSFRHGLTLWADTVSKILQPRPHRDEYISAITDRYESLLIALDRIGQQYYSGAHNESDLLTRYHFNNAISLLSGVTDVLALHIRDFYDISLQDHHTNIRTGDHQLLPEMKSHNKNLYNFLQRNHPVIELIHLIRNDIVHKEGIIKRGPGYELHEEYKSNWKSQIIELNNLDEKKRQKFSAYYQQLDDEIEAYDPVTKWGIITTSGEPTIHKNTSIEPYRFLKNLTFETIEIVDTCLEQLGHANMLDREEPGAFVDQHDIERLMNHDLFPLLDKYR